MKSITQIVLGEEKGGAGVLGEVVLDATPIEGVRLDAISLQITDPNLKLEDWLRIGRMFGHIDSGLNWWIGDWINKGEALYGHEAYQGVESTVSERYDEARRITGKSQITLMNVSSVCSRIARSRRRPELSFRTHEVVAKLEPDEQTHWLQLAVNEGMASDDLRAAIRGKPSRSAPLTEGGDLPQRGRSQEGRVIDPDRVCEAAKRVYHQAQQNGTGDYIVPAEAMAQLASELGED